MNDRSAARSACMIARIEGFDVPSCWRQRQDNLYGRDPRAAVASAIAPTGKRWPCQRVPHDEAHGGVRRPTAQGRVVWPATSKLLSMLWWHLACGVEIGLAQGYRDGLHDSVTDRIGMAKALSAPPAPQQLGPQRYAGDSQELEAT